MRLGIAGLGPLPAARCRIMPHGGLSDRPAVCRRACQTKYQGHNSVPLYSQYSVYSVFTIQLYSTIRRCVASPSPPLDFRFQLDTQDAPTLAPESPASQIALCNQWRRVRSSSVGCMSHDATGVQHAACTHARWHSARPAVPRSCSRPGLPGQGHHCQAAKAAQAAQLTLPSTERLSTAHPPFCPQAAALWPLPPARGSLMQPRK